MTWIDVLQGVGLGSVRGRERAYVGFDLPKHACMRQRHESDHVAAKGGERADEWAAGHSGGGGVGCVKHVSSRAHPGACY